MSTPPERSQDTDPEPDWQEEPDAHNPNDDELIKKLTDNADPHDTDEDEPLPSG